MPATISETQLFEFYARRIWPFQRLFVRSKLSKRCRLCVVSEKYSPLVSGLCQDCRAGQRSSTHKVTGVSADLETQFTALLDSYQGKGRRNFDALVLFSGGKDSAYLLHQLKTKHPQLRLLACCVDSGFLSPAALANLQYVWRRAEIDHLIIKPKPELFKKTFRHALTDLGDRPCYEVVDRLDGDLVHDIGRNLAASLQIPLLISGVSAEQVRRIFKLDSFEMPGQIERQARTHSAEIALDSLYSSEELLYWWNPDRYPAADIARVLFPMVAWQSKEQEVREVVETKKLLPPSNTSPLVTNNRLIPVMGVVDIARQGYSSFEPEFAQMIRDGKSTRELWLPIFELLEYAGKTGFLVARQVDQTLKDLDLTRKELNLLF